MSTVDAAARPSPSYDDAPSEGVAARRVVLPSTAERRRDENLRWSRCRPCGQDTGQHLISDDGKGHVIWECTECASTVAQFVKR